MDNGDLVKRTYDKFLEAIKQIPDGKLGKPIHDEIAVYDSIVGNDGYPKYNVLFYIQKNPETGRLFISDMFIIKYNLATMTILKFKNCIDVLNPHTKNCPI